MQHITLGDQERRMLWMWLGASLFLWTSISGALAYCYYQKKILISSITAAPSKNIQKNSPLLGHQNSAAQCKHFLRVLETTGACIPKKTRLLRCKYTYKKEIILECESQDREELFYFIDTLKDSFPVSLQTISHAADGWRATYICTVNEHRKSHEEDLSHKSYTHHTIS